MSQSNERYEIRGKLGQGGIGAVYRAFDTHLNREVAIKRIIPDESEMSAEDAKISLLKEAKALSALQHPHIVTVYDVGMDEGDDGGAYVVMEILEGRTIEEMVSQGTFVWEDFREVVMQTMEAMIAAQDLDLVHRDLKPANVMVVWLPSGKFQIKLLDFGLAKFSPTPSLQTMDHGHSVFGSIYFMAPEQFERRPLDGRTDLYALGCIYYYALTGQYPFDGDSAPQVMAAHLQHTLIPLSEQRPDLPKWACDWVMWQMERNMDYRPVNAREALKKFLELEKIGDSNAGVQNTATATAGASPSVAGSAPTVATNTAPAAGSPLTRAGQLGGVVSGTTVAGRTGLLTGAVGPIGSTGAVATAPSAASRLGTTAGTRIQLPSSPGSATSMSAGGKKPMAGKTKLIIGLGAFLVVMGIIVGIVQMAKDEETKNVLNYGEKLKQAVSAKNSGKTSSAFRSSPEEIKGILEEMGKDPRSASQNNTEWNAAALYISLIDPSSVNVAEVVFEALVDNPYKLTSVQIQQLLRYFAITPPLTGQVKGSKKAHANFLKLFTSSESTRKYIASYCKALFIREDFVNILQSLTKNPETPEFEMILSYMLKYQDNADELANLVLDELMKTSNIDAQAALIRILANRAQPEGFKILKTFLNSSDNKLNRAGHAALAHWSREDDAFPEIFRMYDAAKLDKERNEIFGIYIIQQLALNRANTKNPSKMREYAEECWKRSKTNDQKKAILIEIGSQDYSPWALEFGEKMLKVLQAQENAGGKNLGSLIMAAEDLTQGMKRKKAEGNK